MDYGKYLDELCEELKNDESWDLPKDERYALNPSICWGLIFL